VSHDRDFLNNVVTSTLSIGQDGRVREYVGGYDDWLRQSAAETPAVAPMPPPSGRERKAPRTEKLRKLSFKEERELEALPERISGLEQEISEIHRVLSDPEVYRTAGADVARFTSRLEELERDLETAYLRWEELEEVRG
jgi:ATP-binding cassette subfamily F protein uup